MWIAGGKAWRQADIGQQRGNPVLQLGLGGKLVKQDRLADGLANGHAWIERRIGVLEDDLQLTAIGPHRLFVEFDNIIALIDHLAFGGPVQVEQGEARSRLAASGFADEAQRLAFENIEIDIIQRMHGRGALAESAKPDMEMLHQIFDTHQRLGSHHAASSFLWATKQATRCAPFSPTPSSDGTRS